MYPHTPKTNVEVTVPPTNPPKQDARDSSVRGFFTKNASEQYARQYNIDHGPRLDNLITRFEINKKERTRFLDVGGGLGFLGQRLNLSDGNFYTVIDGAEIEYSMRLCNGQWITADLDYDKFAKNSKPMFDVCFCLETLEHLTNPYNCLAEIKKLVVENGEVYISIPHFNVTHNYIYPALMWDAQHFMQFLAQMALPVVEYHLWDKGWNAHTFKCRNAPWAESKMLFPKYESKFFGKTPVEYVNL